MEPHLYLIGSGGAPTHKPAGQLEAAMESGVETVFKTGDCDGEAQKNLDSNKKLFLCKYCKLGLQNICSRWN